MPITRSGIGQTNEIRIAYWAAEIKRGMSDFV